MKRTNIYVLAVMLLLPFLTLAQTQETRLHIEASKAFLGMQILKSDAEDEPLSLPFFEDFEDIDGGWLNADFDKNGETWGLF